LGLELAEELGGEIVSADSMQVYIDMDIGTDKPSIEVRARIGHHAIDLVYPDQAFDALRYREAASRSIEVITQTGRTAFVVGGTGLYIRVLLHGLFACPPIPSEVRAALRRQAREFGVVQLYEELKQVDRTTANRVHPHDALRIVRALEVYRASGRPISELRQTHGSVQGAYRSLKLALEVERDDLYSRIDTRVDGMIERGLLGEVERLLNLGYTRDLRSMQGLGYRQIGAYLHGDCSLERAIELIKRDTRRYAKRQWTWFRGDSDVRWLTGKNSQTEAVKMAKNFLKL
jgi:tRNA dimethylallyltransferase